MKNIGKHKYVSKCKRFQTIKGNNIDFCGALNVYRNRIFENSGTKGL